MRRFKSEVLSFLKANKKYCDDENILNDDAEEDEEDEAHVGSDSAIPDQLPSPSDLGLENSGIAPVEDSTDTLDITLGAWLAKHNYSYYFIHYYIIPVCAAVWSCPSHTAMQFQAIFLFQFFKNHHLLQLVGMLFFMPISRNPTQF